MGEGAVPAGGSEVAGVAAHPVRGGRAEDRPELARLRWEWRVEAGEVPRGTAAQFTTDFSVWAADHAGTHLPFVAGGGAGEALVGMAWLALLERVPGPGVWLRRSAFLQSVYVDPAVRGGGIGLALVEAAVDAARRHEVQYVTVNPSDASIPMYRRAGFEPRANVLRLSL